jgi:hypothetical protein
MFFECVKNLRKPDGEDAFGDNLTELVGPYLELVSTIEPSMPLSARERRDMLRALPIAPELKRRSSSLTLLNYTP